MSEMEDINYFLRFLIRSGILSSITTDNLSPQFNNNRPLWYFFLLSIGCIRCFLASWSQLLEYHPLAPIVRLIIGDFFYYWWPVDMIATGINVVLHPG